MGLSPRVGTPSQRHKAHRYQRRGFEARSDLAHRYLFYTYAVSLVSYAGSSELLGFIDRKYSFYGDNISLLLDSFIIERFGIIELCEWCGTQFWTIIAYNVGPDQKVDPLKGHLVASEELPKLHGDFFSGGGM